MRRLLAGAFTLALVSPLAGEIEKLSLVSRVKARTYYLFVPLSVAAEKPAPLLVTLHGSGRNGKILLQKWKDLAEKEGIVLAGPDSADSEVWSSPGDGPLFLYELVEVLKSKHPIDPRRVYLFGHSSGGMFALQIGSLESEYFAAAAISAGALPSQQYSIHDYATRKIPFVFFVGTRDPLFSVREVRANGEALTSRGFPVEITEIRGLDHNYYASSGMINRSAWEFLRKHQLSADPKYTPYLEKK